MPHGTRGYELCYGCGVCTLSCPIWQQGRDALATFMGRALALQRGAGLQEIEDSVNSCMLCGSCEPVCALEIPTVDITMSLRSQLAGGSPYKWQRGRPGTPGSNRGSLLLPGRALREHKELLRRVENLLGLEPADDNGTDILDAYENGRTPDSERVSSFLESIAGAGRLVAAEGLMKRFIRAAATGIEVIGLGEALLKLDAIRASLRPDDLYIIEARAYNADFKRCAPFYTELSRQTGCAMNLNLQRVAIPTGTFHRAVSESPSTPEISAQTSWILQDMSFKRIVVEAVEDMEILSKTTGVPVMHVAELAGEAQ